MTARRTAGRLGCGGGPPAVSGLRLFPPPVDGFETQVLQVGEGDAGHQSVPVQPGPGAALEVAEAQLLLELLVRLLAPVYGRFAEGLDLPDLVEAKRLVDGLKG